MVFNILLNQIYTSISSAFGWGESVFGAFGISLLLLFMCMVAISFFVARFIKPFI